MPIFVDSTRSTGDIALMGEECRHAHHVGQVALHLPVTDEDTAGPPDHPVHQMASSQRGRHLAGWTQLVP